MKDLIKRQVSRELQKLMKIGPINKPNSGWINVIRDALGMSKIQLAKRLGISQQRISKLESAESTQVLKIKTLEEAAKALNCKLVYFLVPIEPIETILKKRAYALAKKRIEESSHSKDLEAQPVSRAEKDQQIKELANDLLINHPKELWNE